MLVTTIMNSYLIHFITFYCFPKTKLTSIIHIYLILMPELSPLAKKYKDALDGRMVVFDMDGEG